MAATLRSPRGFRLVAKYGLLAALYFSQGLPFGFFTQAMPVLLREQGYSLVDIGLLSFLALPWALKFVWAPVVDGWYSQALGRRRSWLLPLQGLAVLALVALSEVGLEGGVVWLLIGVFVINLLSATQDIATDGLAIDLLEPHERGFANGLQVAGYRVGMILGGGVLLFTFDRLGLARTFQVMAGSIALASVPVLALRETTPPADAAVASVRPWTFFRHRKALPILALLCIYKAPDALATSMLRPFLSDAGLDLDEIGWLLGTVGFVSGLLGAVAGGALVTPLGRRRALLLFGVLQGASLAGYAYAALVPSPELLPWVCGAEHFAGGMATAALFTCMMDWCARENSATDYTIQASAVVIATIGAGALGGFSATELGYATHFLLAIGLSALAVAGTARLWYSVEDAL